MHATAMFNHVADNASSVSLERRATREAPCLKPPTSDRVRQCDMHGPSLHMHCSMPLAAEARFYRCFHFVRKLRDMRTMDVLHAHTKIGVKS